MNKIKILIAEDHASLREGLKLLIAAEPDLEISGVVDSSAQAVELAAEVLPDVVLMDLALPATDGVEATREISGRLPNTKVLVLSAFGGDELLRRATEAGAAGFLTKRAAAYDLPEAIRAVHNGQRYFSGHGLTRRGCTETKNIQQV